MSFFKHGWIADEDNTSKTSELPSTEKMIGDTKTRTDAELGGAYLKQGNAKYCLQDFTGAILDFSKVIGFNPKDTGAFFLRDAYFLRGVGKKMLKDKWGALEDLSKAGELGEAKAYEQIQRIQKGN